MLANGRRVLGYATYPKTLSAHSASQQRAHTLLVTNNLLAEMRAHVPGFAPIELHIAEWLRERFDIEPEVRRNPASACLRRPPSCPPPCALAARHRRAPRRRSAPCVPSVRCSSSTCTYLLAILLTYLLVYSQLFYAHALRQSPETLAATGFDV